MEMVGDISWPEHCAIFTTPQKMAESLNIPLLFYGENPQDQYGGPIGSAEARQLTSRWRSEFGGFLGLRPDDFVGMEGITERDMREYTPPDAVWPLEAHFLGQYLPWDSRDNARFAVGAGLMVGTPSRANFWPTENLDNAQTGLHDYFMFRKFGFGRGCQQISCDVRFGRVSRDFALHWVAEHDSIFPEVYAGVPVGEVLDRIGMTRARLDELIERFSNKELV
jgi:hypothetical protein